ncbi:hypothetical protein HO173_004536 [Letharia columbiana]|uniref:Uncharacterized protein n=1 Tax=Letharia columbiana TaxID=112416 RepID=A0A8H6FY92_9LECA|nr:uncharacterized protein HO173_004536 [Letharia columbiana]KAF6237069.1 hypothetical protein HO173_004536 [Letharia columbiana]
MAAVFGTLHNHQVGNSHRTQEKEPSPWEFSTPDNQDTGPTSSTPYPTNNQTPQQKLNFDPPSPPKFNGLLPAHNHPTTPDRHGQAYLSGRQSQPRSGTGIDPSYLSPPPKIGSRPELNASRSGSEADSLLDLYSKPRSLGETSLRESMDRTDRGLAQEEPFLEVEDPERSRWIHRDKLAMIESHEMQEAGIKLPPQRQRSITSRSRSRREKNRSQDQSTVAPDRDEGMPPLKDRQDRRTETPTRQDDRGEQNVVNEFDIRTPEEIAADNHIATNLSNGYHQPQPDLRKSSSRIPLPRSSPMPIPQEHIERDHPLPRKRGTSGNYSNSDDNGLSYSRIRSRNSSVGSAILLDDIDNTPNHTPTPASNPGPLNQFTPSNTQRTPSSAQRPKPRSGLDTTPLSQKPRIISTTPTSLRTPSSRTPSSTVQRPKSRSGLEPRPATAINRPVGEAPWLATMYKPDPRLPPEEQLLPTHAKRLQQEQWERAQKESQQRMREVEAQQRKHHHQKPTAQLPREFSPLAEHTINGLQPSSRDADEKPLQDQSSASEWPLTQATPRKPPPASGGGLNANPAAGGGDDGGQHAGYSPIPRVKQGASPTLGNVTDIRPGQRALDPFERERMARRDEEKGGRADPGKKKEKGCGCCVVM